MDDCITDMLAVPGEYCPDALTDWLNYYSSDNNINDRTNSCAQVKEKARRHLSAIGWVFWHTVKKDKLELRYTSPDGKCYYSLKTACRAAYQEQMIGHESTLNRLKMGDSVPDDREVVEPKRKKNEESSLAPIEFWCPVGTDNLSVANPVHHKIQENDIPVHVESVCSVQTTCKCLFDQDKKEIRHKRILAGHEKELTLHVEDNYNRTSKKIGGKSPKVVDRTCKSRYRDVRSSMIVRDKIFISKGKPINLLSWLIAKNMILPGGIVVYYNRTRDLLRKEGVITRSGIECECCKKIFTIGEFEVHADSKSTNPTNNILLFEDGKSLLQCQVELMGRYKNVARLPLSPTRNDEICSVCQCGGILALCDQCPSSFHMNCLGRQRAPDGSWFCPSCCCKICGMNLPEDLENSSSNYVSRRCQQCQIKFHPSCINGGVIRRSKSMPAWFCSKECEAVNWSISEIIEKPVSILRNNLKVSLLKPVEFDKQDDIEKSAESFSRLCLALGVMNECFEPIIDPFTKGNILEDVVFNKESKLNRVNFRGFYTVALESNEEMIAVAFVRIHGKMVAEIPIIGTRFQYRRQGMCRIIMNELKRLLVMLGVHKLVLPAIPSILQIWTDSFGFSPMKDHERLQLVHHTFLEFQETILCQKLLKPL